MKEVVEEEAPCVKVGNMMWIAENVDAQDVTVGRPLGFTQYLQSIDKTS